MENTILVQWGKNENDDLEVKVTAGFDDNHEAAHVLAIIVEELAEQDGMTLPDFMLHHTLSQHGAEKSKVYPDRDKDQEDE